MRKIPKSWEKVLCLPILLASNTIPLFNANKRIPVIVNSRTIIKITIQALITCNCRNAQKTPIVRILSAIGSKSFPKSETIFFFLAIYPSKKSVEEAKINRRKAKIRETNVFFKINPTHKKERNTLRRVKRLAIFIPLLNHILRLLLSLPHRNHLSLSSFFLKILLHLFGKH